MNKNDFNWDFTNQREQKVYETQTLSARRAQSSNLNAKFEMMWSPLLSVDPKYYGKDKWNQRKLLFKKTDLQVTVQNPADGLQFGVRV